MKSHHYRVVYPYTTGTYERVGVYMDTAILGNDTDDLAITDRGRSVPEIICSNCKNSMLARINCEYFGGFDKAPIEYKCPGCGRKTYLPPQPQLLSDEFWRGDAE